MTTFTGSSYQNFPKFMAALILWILFRFLAESGIDSTKADVQCIISEMASTENRGSLAAPYQNALKKSSQKHLQSKTIYCMCHVSDIFFGWLMPKDRPPVLCRNSDGKYSPMSPMFYCC